tara:strand:+ start:21 stop:1127 length:1107 start_codon:yes stop_codon:yes gene_type:complete
MIYNNHISKINNWEFLKKTKDKKQIPHALFFYGNSGIGKELAAIEFAAYINCQKPINDFACRNCVSCNKLVNNNHEYIEYIFPLPKGKITSKKDDINKSFSEKTLIEYNNQLMHKLNNPFHEIDIKGANTILINSIRSIKKKLYRTIDDESYRVIIIFQSEKLCHPNNESANSLLKILEEPPNKSIFILVSSKPNLLLDTIKSRCIELYFSNPTREIFNNYNDLLEHTDIDLYRLLNANIKYLKNLDSKFINEIKNLIKGYNQRMLKNNNDIDLKIISYLAKLSKNNNLLFHTFIQGLKCYYKDIANLKFNSNYKPIFPFIDIEDAKKIKLNNFNYIDIIENFEKDCLINLNLELSLLNLFQELKDIK